MGVRETLNKQPAITTGATIGIIVIALVFIIYQVSGGRRMRIPTKAYYTIDDGASYYSDDINLVPPYQYEGKDAVKANVFKCPGSKEFVGYLERYTPDAKKIIEISRTKPTADYGGVDQAMATGLEVKAPLTGDKGWAKTMMPAADKIVVVKCSDGSSIPEPVLP